MSVEKFTSQWFRDLAQNPAAQSEFLPFTITRAHESELGAIAKLRAATYGKHLPGLGAKLADPELADYDSACEILVAKSKMDGSLLGTLRTHVNTTGPIPIQESIELSDTYRGERMVETTRLCIARNPLCSLVRNMLFKALFKYCSEQNVTWMMAAGRKPVDRIYDSLMFADVAKPFEYYPLAHAGNIPHRIMSFSTFDARDLWLGAGHPLYKFIFETNHPDIDLSGVRNIDSDSGWGALSFDSMDLGSLDEAGTSMSFGRKGNTSH